MKKHVFLILLFLFFLVNCYIYWGHAIIVLVDIGREFLIPQAMLDGHVLYKDILNIYGPLAYFINAAAFFILGAKFNTLFITGAVSALIFTYAFYFLACEFLSRQVSFALTALVMTLCMFNLSLFNYLLPYSYDMLYGIAACAVSVLLLVKYIKSGGGGGIYPFMATLSAGFSLSCKIEYYWLPLILAYVFLFVKPLNKSELLKSLLAFCIFPLLCAGILFVQGINLIDIAHAAEIIKKSAFVPAMMRFHAQIGIYPNPKLLLENLTGLFNLILILVCLYFVFFSEKIKKIFKWLIAACLFIFIGDVHYFAYFPIICAVFTLLNIKKIYNKPAGILAFAGIGASLKTFYSLHLDAYGSYTLPLVLLALLVLIFECYNFNKEKLQKFYVFVLALFAGFYFIFGLSKNIIYPQGKISGAGGSLIVHKEYIEPLNSIADYIKTNTAPSDRILVYPEGEVINILTGRKTDNMLYSLHPIFIETFGQDNIVNRINNEKIEYIVYIEGLMEAVWAPGKYEKLNNFIKSEYERIYFVPMTEPLHGISLYKLRSR